MMALMMSFCVANAQLATENAKFFDNTYVGVGGQASTPLDFNGALPLNGGVSVVLGKQLTPVFGVNIEDNVWFSSHSNGSHTFGVPHFDGINHNVVRGNYLGLNGTVNFMNLFGGYKGTPRLFEVQAIGGLGWWHIFVPNDLDVSDLGVKTGVNLLFNLGQKKDHGIYIQPSVLWNMTNPASERYSVAFNKMGAQLALQVGYVYRFKTSNGTHHFKVYDVGAMNAEIARLNDELAKKPKVVTREKIVKAFQDPCCPFKVIIANPFAVAESISLHKACHNAIYIERSFNAAHFVQSKDRIHRYGLKPGTITNYYYILSQNTIDETIDTRLQEKEQRMTEIMESMPIPLFNNISEDLGDDDIKALIKDYVRRTKKN